MAIDYAQIEGIARGLDVENLRYSYVLIFVAICAIGVNYGFRLRFSKKLKLFLFTDLLILVIYLIWDFWAVSKGSWYFDSNQILGIKLFGKLPIEEVLFFIIVPLMTVLTYLALIKLTSLVKSTSLVKRVGSDNSKKEPHVLL
jgi:lycopene cyclase domain-containing protein